MSPLNFSTTSIALAVVACLAVAPTVGAQEPTLTTDVGLNSAYVWRGVTSTNRFVVEPDLLLDVPLGRRLRTTLSVGAWTNLEPTHYTGPHDLSALDGNVGPVATSSQLWVEAKRAAGDGAVTLGATRYLYPNVADIATTYNTTEVYAIASAPRLLGLPVTPTLSAYYDAQKVRGAYVEGSLSRDVGIAVGRRLRQAVTFTATAGYSAGQGEDAAGVDAAYFANDGLTHLELAARTMLMVAGVSVAPSAHVVFGRDELARLTAPDEHRSAKLWIGTSLSWGHALGRSTSASESTAKADGAIAKPTEPTTEVAARPSTR